MTLGVITALYMQLGKRGMSIDAVVHGNMEDTSWNEKVWDFIPPKVLQLATAAKGDKADSAMSLEHIMHRRCPRAFYIGVRSIHLFFFILVLFILGGKHRGAAFRHLKGHLLVRKGHNPVEGHRTRARALLTPRPCELTHR